MGGDGGGWGGYDDGVVDGGWRVDGCREGVDVGMGGKVKEYLLHSTVLGCWH